MADRRRKFLLLLVCLTAAMLFTAGCTPQEKKPLYSYADTDASYHLDPTQAKPILGTWTAESITADNQVYTMAEYVRLKGEDMSSTYTLREDSTVLVTYTNGSEEGTFTFDGKVVEILLGSSRYRFYYEADSQTLTRTKEATDEVITYRKTN